MFDNMPPWAIVTHDNKLFNSSLFRTANFSSQLSLSVRAISVIAFPLLMIIYAIILAKKRDIKWIYRQKFLFRKQPPDVFYVKTGVLRNLAKFTGKHLCQSLFLNKVGTGVFLWQGRNQGGRWVRTTPYPLYPLCAPLT